MKHATYMQHDDHENNLRGHHIDEAEKILFLNKKLINYYQWQIHIAHKPLAVCEQRIQTNVQCRSSTNFRLK